MPASGPAGLVLAYRPDVYHRGVRMTAPRAARFMLHVSYKPAATDWLGSFGLPDAGEDMAWHRFVDRATERQLTVLGFPAPGHPYWTAQTLAGVAARYPMLDLSPWRNAARPTTDERPAWIHDGRTPGGRTGVLYQIYPRSFADTNADGVGDLPGIIEHLDHLAWLGVDGIWLSPVTVSPNADWGYDVSDFCAVAPEFGTLDDFDRLVAEAGERGIRVLMDIVPNHTSEQHPWFVDSRSSRTSAHRDWYVWADGKEGGAPPNNWVSSFGGPGWTFDEAHRPVLLPQPPGGAAGPQLVERGGARRTFDGIFRFWSDRGVAGFRIDVCNIIIKDAELRDNPPATEDDDFETQMFGQRSVYNANRPEVHDVIRRWRRLADGYDEPRLLIGETPVPVDRLAAYYGDGHGRARSGLQLRLHRARPSRPRDMRAIVEEHRGGPAAGRLAGVDGLQPRHVPLPHPLGRGRSASGSAWPSSCCSEPSRHPGALPGRRDRHGQRHGGPRGHAGPARGALLPLLRGARRRPHADAVERRTGRRLHRRPHDRGSRSATWRAANVAAQRDDPGSVLTLCRDVIAFRRRHPEFSAGDYERACRRPRTSGPGRVGARHVVALNMSAGDVVLEDAFGTVRVCTDRAREGEVVGGLLRLAPYQGVVTEFP